MGTSAEAVSTSVGWGDGGGGAFVPTTRNVQVSCEVSTSDAFGGLVADPVAAPVRVTGAAFKAGVHRLIVRPAIYLLSSLWLRRRMLALLAGCCSVIDVAAGDDGTNVSLAKRGVRVHANDLDAEALQALQKDAERNGVASLITFGCEDARCLEGPGRAFDGAVMKNVTHHLHSWIDVEIALRSALDIAPQAIVMDIEEPSRSLRGRLFNAYYRRFLGDDGFFFINLEDLVGHVSAWDGLRVLDRGRVHTIKGTYLFCRVIKEVR